MSGSDKKNVEWAGVASTVGAFVQITSTESGDSFGVGYLTAEDKADIDDVFADKENRCLIFPGTSLAYGSEEDALS